MAIDAGTVYYTVEAETEKLLFGSRDADKALNDLDKGMKKVDASSKKLGTEQTKLSREIRRMSNSARAQSSAMSGLTKIVSTYLSLRALQYVVSVSDAYGQMSSRIRNATRSEEEYELVQRRLLQTADGTYRALSEAQEVYIASESSLRELGYTIEEVLDITDSMSYAFVRDAARKDQATTAMDAYSKALMKGRIDADGWASMMAAMPSIVDGISEATGRSAQEIRQLGSTGKLSIEALNEGLRRGLATNKQYADNMETSVGDAIVNLSNAFSVFIGEMNASSGASSILVDNIQLLADALKDPQVIEAAQVLAAGIIKTFGTIIDGAKDVVGFTRWMGEQVAAALHGPAADDITRIDEQLAAARDALQKGWFKGDRIRFLGPDGIISFMTDSELKAEISRLETLKNQYHAVFEPLEQAANIEPPTLSTGEYENALNKAASARNRLVSAEREAGSSGNAAAKAADKNIETLRRLEQEVVLATLASQGLTEEMELMTTAFKLNDQATIEQIEHALELTRALNHLKMIDSIREKIGDDPAAYVRGDVSPLSGGPFDNQTARFEAEAAAEEQRYTDQLIRLREAMDAQLLTQQEYQSLFEASAQQHADRMAQIEKAKSDVMLNSAAGAFGQMADDLAAYVQVFGSENKALMATMKAAAIAQTIIQTYQGAQQAFTSLSAIPVVGPALGTAAAAAAVAGGMARVAAIRSQSIPGRQYGGPVAPGSMYRINENGAPEVFQASNGQQFMLPNTRGEVVSNADASSGMGGATINQTLNINGDVTPEMLTLLKEAARKGAEEGYKAVLNDFRRNGPARRMITRK